MRLDLELLLTIMLVVCMAAVVFALVLGRLDGLSCTGTVVFALLAGGVTTLMCGLIFYLVKIAGVIE